MDNYMLHSETEMKPDADPATTICRCCLSTEKRVKNIARYNAYFMDLAGINVTESDGLPQWLCWECSALLQKAVKFKHKMLKAHNLLYDYLSRCAPFPLDAQDPELSKYASPQLTPTHTLNFDSLKGKTGFSKILQHVKDDQRMELDFDMPIELPQVPTADYNVKEETGFSDYEDNITLEEYRSNVSKLTEDDIITEDDLAELLEVSEKMQKQEAGNKKKKTKRKEEKKEKEVVKKKKSNEEPLDTEESSKSSLRSKPVELDPAKIRVVMLNPEEQIKQREEESKANLKFPFQCQLCFKGYNFESKLQNHMGKHKPARGQFECKLCSMYFPTQYSFTVHSYIHTRRYECVPCGRRMIDRYSIMDHYKIQHEGLVSMFTCHLCGKVSNNNKTHRGHMRNHHSGDRPSCDQCGKSFVNKDSLAEHIQIHQGIKNYSCGTCGKRFRTRTQIKHHQLKHSDAREFYCVECDTRFKSAHSLRQHLQKSVKHKDKHSLKFPCERCDKRFDTEARLQHHVSIHHDGIRPHRCQVCGAALATLGSLSKHVQAVHGKRRPPPKHVCHQCGKAFRGKSVLINHVRTHTGEKPFECAECGRKFAQRTAMRTHVKLVHLKFRRSAKKQFECAECGRKFAQRTAMRTHVKLVHLKFRRSAKIKPELALEPPPPPEPVKMDLFPKQEPALAFDSWRPMQGDVYFHLQP